MAKIKFKSRGKHGNIKDLFPMDFQIELFFIKILFPSKFLLLCMTGNEHFISWKVWSGRKLITYNMTLVFTILNTAITEAHLRTGSTTISLWRSCRKSSIWSNQSNVFIPRSLLLQTSVNLLSLFVQISIDTRLVCTQPQCTPQGFFRLLLSFCAWDFFIL